MSALTVIHNALTSTEAQRARGPEDVAVLVLDALVAAGRLTDTAARCRSLFQSTTSDRLIRCTKALRHDAEHTNNAGTQTVRWLDDQAAGVLRERI